MSFFLFPWTVRSFPFFPIPRAHFVRGRIAITSIICRFQLSDGTNAVWTLTLSLPASYCLVPGSLLAGGNEHNSFGGSGETGPSDCVNCPYLFVSSRQNIFLVTTIFMFPSHFTPATCRWEAGMEKSDCRTFSGYGICRDAGQTQKKSIADSCFWLWFHSDNWTTLTG